MGVLLVQRQEGARAEVPRRVTELDRRREAGQVGHPIGERPACHGRIEAVSGLGGDIGGARQRGLVELAGQGGPVLIHEIAREQPACPSLRQSALVELDQQRGSAGGAEILVGEIGRARVGKECRYRGTTGNTSKHRTAATRLKQVTSPTAASPSRYINAS